jgi:hypothetical protein
MTSLVIGSHASSFLRREHPCPKCLWPQAFDFFLEHREVFDIIYLYISFITFVNSENNRKTNFCKSFIWEIIKKLLNSN